GRLDDVVVGGLPAARAVLAERRERRIDQPRIDRREVLVAEAEGRERAGAIVLDEHVGGGDQLLEDGAVALRLEVERDRPLVGGLGQESRAHVAAVERLVGAGAAALGGVVGGVGPFYVGAPPPPPVSPPQPRPPRGCGA